MTRKLLISLVTALAMGFALPAMATPVTGQATNGLGGSNIATGADGWVDFYIPLDGSQVFDGSLVADTCSFTSSNPSNRCGGGELTMFMHFDVSWTGATQLIVNFDDFDHPGYGDTSYFTELLLINVYDADGVLFAAFDEAAIALLISGNTSTQQLIIDLNISGDFDVEFIFSTEFAAGTTGRWRNTLESLHASAVSVPEPGTLALLGAGLLLLGFSRRRKAHLVRH